MRRAVRQEQEERPLRVVFDKTDGFLGKPPCQTALVNRLIDSHRIPVQRLFCIVGLQQAVELIKAMCIGLMRLRMVAQVPFADQSRAITSALQQVCDSRRICRQTACVTSRDGPVGQSVTDCVTAGKQAGARWAAHIAAGVKIRQADALTGKTVKVRRLDQFGSVDANIAITQVIGQDQDDVWL